MDRVRNLRTGEEYEVRTVSTTDVTFYLDPNERRAEVTCRVYWGSHGCCLERGHGGPHLCDCAYGDDGDLLPHMDDEDNGNVGRPPYYGPDTHFYGEDV